ncbi:hypothetical protein D3C73_581700 [compost metagenome]
MARRLNILLQNDIGITPRNEDVGAHDLGRITAADAQQIGRNEIDPQTDADRHDEQEHRKTTKNYLQHQRLHSVCGMQAKSATEGKAHSCGTRSR